MILGTGIDLVNISRIEKVFYKFGDKFTERILTTSEELVYKQINNTKQKIAYLAKRFAAKEAFSKALGEGIGVNISFKDIEIKKDKKNKPYISYSNKLNNFINYKYNTNLVHCHLSIADTENFATAHVIIEKEYKC